MAGMKLTNTFDRYTRKLIRDMEADGWTGYLSSNKHVIMRAPDGVTTCSVMPKVGDPRNKHNIAAPYLRWKREQAEEAAENTADDLAWYRAELLRLQGEIARLQTEVSEWQRLAQEAIDLL